MASTGPLHALNHRIDFANEVAEGLSDVLDAHLCSENGSSYQWQEDRALCAFGKFVGGISSKPEPNAMAKSSMSIVISCAGEANFEISDWTQTDFGDWEEAPFTCTVPLRMDGSPDDAVAAILSNLMMNGSNFSSSLRNFLERRLSTGQEPDLFPQPDA